MSDKHRCAISWCILGGESGSQARPCNIAWLHSCLQQCQAAGVACFIKQLGAHPLGHDGEQSILGATDQPFGPYWRRLKDRKGADIEEWPEWARVQQFPAEEPWLST